MRFSDRYTQLFRFLLPAPFTIAVLLTIVTFFLALGLTTPSNSSASNYAIELLYFWEDGIWNNNLMVFAMQMMLMLVLGHTLALTPPAEKLITKATAYCNTTARAVFVVSLCTMLVAFFNWGLGLIFGAIFARKVGEYAQRHNLALNYPMVGAAGYSGLMVWHGGFSGSSLIKVAEPNHLSEIMAGILPEEQLQVLPDRLLMSDTVFSTMNLCVSAALLLFVPLSMYLLAGQRPASSISINKTHSSNEEKSSRLIGAEKLDYSRLLSLAFGLVVLGFAVYKSVIAPSTFTLSFITPNFINFVLLGAAIMLHKNFHRFIAATNEAILGASGILIQFPLYFGIMAIMKSSGLVAVFSAFFVDISTALSFPIYSFFSAGLVNVFVPSGGGQWAVQGPILIKAALELNVPLWKSILALAYGDQVTNMLQPFWALPLLGITGLSARAIHPYTLFLMCVGSAIFLTALLLF
jgi:short-chain fatty acids transporter